MPTQLRSRRAAAALARLVLPACLVLGGIPGCGPGSRPPVFRGAIRARPLPVPSPAAGQVAYPVSGEGKPEIILASTGLLAGLLEATAAEEIPGSGGLARRAGYLAAVARAYPDVPVLHFETGDSFDGVPERIEALLRGLDRIGLDAYNVGGRELAIGLPRFLAVARRSRLPFLSTNLAYGDGTPVLDPYRLLKVTGADGRPMRVLVLGVGGWGLLGRAGIGDAEFEAPARAVRRMLGRLRGVADLTILLAAGYEPVDLSLELIDVEGIDMILSSSETMGGRSALMSRGKVRMAVGGFEGRWIGDLRMVGESWENRSVFLEAALPESPELAAIVAAAPAYQAGTAVPRAGAMPRKVR